MRSQEVASGGRTSVLADPDEYDPSEQQFMASLEAPAPDEGRDPDRGILGSSTPSLAGSSARDTASTSDLPSSSTSWRQEVASRVENFRARRGRRRDETMTFQFEPPSPESWGTAPPGATPVATAHFEYYRSLTAQAVARLDAARALAEAEEREKSGDLAFEGDSWMVGSAIPGNSQDSDIPPATEPDASPAQPDTSEQYFGWHDGAAVPSSEPQPGSARNAADNVPEGKIIEFPRPAVLIPPGSELAEPVLDKPRILDVPETVATANAPLAGISLESPEDMAPLTSFDVDLPLIGASMSLRVFSGILDLLVVLVATAMFLVVTLQMKAPLPSDKFGAAILAALPLVFWGLYNYLFLVYAGATPGMRISRLELTSFEGGRVPQTVRRWRALTMGLSAASLGLGLVWALFDEDTLCWHDRITRTYVTAVEQ